MAAEEKLVDLMANLEQSVEEAKAARDAKRASERNDWLAWRREGIGASDVPGILGLSRWASPWSIWCEKSGLLPLDDTDDDYRKFGRYAERMVAPWFTDETGLYVVGEQTRCTHREHPWRRCTVDGFVAESVADAVIDMDAVLGLIQIKTTGPGRRWDELPPDMQAQGQYELHVTDLERSWFPILHGRRLEIYELERDDEDIAVIVEQVDRFWHEHVVAGVAPELDGHDATLAALAVLYPTSVPGKSVPIDHAVAALELLRDATERRKAAEFDENGAKAVLRYALGDAYEGTVNDDRAITCGVQTRKVTCGDCGHVDESDPFRTLRPTGRWKV